jgi:hypothetical protein
MSFRLFIYYCALLGGLAAFGGWAVGRGIHLPGNKIAEQGFKALCLGLCIAFALALVDALANLSLRRIGQVGLQVWTAAVGGAFAGLLGGIVGQMLYRLAPWGPFQVLGWAVTGSCIGAALGLFDLLAALARRQEAGGALSKLRNGLLGGGVGGLVGGTLSLVLHGVWDRYFQGRPHELLWSPSAWGFVALGICIGLMIGLAQVYFKEASLRVEKGFRAGRELILSRPEMTIGRAEACDLGLFGDPRVEKQHARLLRLGGRYFLEDLGTPGGTYVNGARVADRRQLQAGDEIRVGRCLLRYDERQ